MPVPRFFDCQYVLCNSPSVRGFDGCGLCHRHLCIKHLNPAFHQCKLPKSDVAYQSQVIKEVQEICSRINEEALCAYASKLNGGKECVIHHSPAFGPKALIGCANYHMRISYDEQQIWLARVPRITSHSAGLSQALVDYLVRIEVALLEFLEPTNDHGVGVSFILIEEIKGVPWNGQESATKDATDDDKKKIWSQPADIFIELERHLFPRAGSFISGSPEFSIGGVASDRFIVLDPFGPYDNASNYYTAFADQYLDLIVDGQLYTNYPVEAFLMYSFLRANVSQLVECGVWEFYIKHVDDKGDHFIVDDDLNIKGVIDWQMARIVPRREAFAPPLVTADMSALCNGRVSLSAQDQVLSSLLRDKKAYEIASIMATGEKIRRFFWALGNEQGWRNALPLAEAIF